MACSLMGKFLSEIVVPPVRRSTSLPHVCNHLYVYEPTLFILFFGLVTFHSLLLCLAYYYRARLMQKRVMEVMGSLQEKGILRSTLDANQPLGSSAVPVQYNCVILSLLDTFFQEYSRLLFGYDEPSLSLVSV